MLIITITGLPWIGVFFMKTVVGVYIKVYMRC